jgi:hypothetical protein
METGQIALVLCLVVLMVVGINGVLIISLLRGKTTREIELIRRASQSIRNPWKSENANLKELSQWVAQFEDREAIDEKDDER